MVLCTSDVNDAELLMPSRDSSQTSLNRADTLTKRALDETRL